METRPPSQSVGSESVCSTNRGGDVLRGKVFTPGLNMQRLALREIPQAIHYDSYFHRIYITLGTTRNLEMTSTDERMWCLACKRVPFPGRTWAFRDFGIYGGVVEQNP